MGPAARLFSGDAKWRLARISGRGWAPGKDGASRPRGEFPSRSRLASCLLVLVPASTAATLTLTRARGCIPRPATWCMEPRIPATAPPPTAGRRHISIIPRTRRAGKTLLPTSPALAGDRSGPCMHREQAGPAPPRPARSVWSSGSPGRSWQGREGVRDGSAVRRPARRRVGRRRWVDWRRQMAAGHDRWLLATTLASLAWSRRAEAGDLQTLRRSLVWVCDRGWRWALDLVACSDARRNE